MEVPYLLPTLIMIIVIKQDTLSVMFSLCEEILLLQFIVANSTAEAVFYQSTSVEFNAFEKN